MKKIKIKTAYHTRFGRLQRDYLTITMEAVRAVLSAADVDRITDVFMASYAPQELCGIPDPLACVKNAIQSGYPSLRCEFHGLYKTGAEALHAAIELTVDGDTGDVLVVGSEKMTERPAGDAAGILAERENPHHRAYGATLPALGALVTRAYLRRHRVPSTALDDVSVKNHAHGALNPRAHYRSTIDRADVETSPMVADPLRRLHCAPMSDGAAALLIGAEGGNVTIRGWGKGIDTPLFQDRIDTTRFAATAEAARAACRQASVAINDIDVVEVHDAFSSFELINLEDLGFFEPGTAWRALAAGQLTIDGRLPVNPSGGMKARGHPIGASGLSSLVEINDQLTGSAGARQQPGADLGLVQSVGGVSDASYVFILDRGQCSKEPRP